MTGAIAGLLLAGVVVFYVLLPLLTGRSAPMGRDDSRATAAEHRKRIALLGLRDVEYDFLAGKLDEVDYREMKGTLTAEALEAMDADAADRSAQSDSGAERAALEAEIEALRASLREGGICPACGHPNARRARFCGACGSTLPVREGSRTSGGA